MYYAQLRVLRRQWGTKLDMILTFINLVIEERTGKLAKELFN